MARRTKEQNAAIYRRRAERAKARGTTYGKEKRAQDNARARARAIASFGSLVGTRARAEYVVNGLRPVDIKKADTPEHVRELAGKGLKEFLYHFDWERLGL